MRSPAAIVAHVDALVQRRFDQLVHAVMRKTGASKRVMRRNGWVPIVTMWALLLGTGAGRAFGSSFNMLIYLAVLWADDTDDRRAEQRDMRPHADGCATQRKVAGMVFCVASLLPSGSLFVSVALGMGIVWFYQGYLCRTSPTVPPKKEREPKLVLVSCAEVA